MLATCQELGFSVRVMSISDTSAHCRSVIAYNCSPEHVYADMNAQALGQACLSHVGCGSTCFVKGADFGVTGTMCTPYSQQRAKRFAPGSVMSHDCESLTSSDLLQWIGRMAPMAGVCENVDGWDMPESSLVTRTPLERQIF